MLIWILVRASSKPEVAGDEGSSSARRPPEAGFAQSAVLPSVSPGSLFSCSVNGEVMRCSRCAFRRNTSLSVAEPLFGHEQPLFGREMVEGVGLSHLTGSLLRRGSVEKPSAPGR